MSVYYGRNNRRPKGDPYSQKEHIEISNILKIGVYRDILNEIQPFKTSKI